MTKPQQQERDFIKNCRTIVTPGDLNAYVTDNQTGGVKHRFHEPFRNDNGDILVDFWAKIEND